MTLYCELTMACNLPLLKSALREIVISIVSKEVKVDAEELQGQV